MPLRLYITLICFFMGGRLSAQTMDENDFIRYTTRDGLSDNHVTGVIQDDKGFIWVSTLNGLTRFDGQEMQRIHQQPYKPGLISDHVFGIKGMNSKLLVYSYKGAQWIQTTTNKYINLLTADSSRAASFQDKVYDAAITGNGICAVSARTGFYAFDSTGKVIFRYDFYKYRYPQGDFKGKKNYGRFLLSLDSFRVLQFDYACNMRVYDSKLNRFLSLAECMKNYAQLFGLQGKSLDIKGTLGKNKVIFSEAHTHIIVYDIEKDKLQRQPVPDSLQIIFHWPTRWLMLNDSLGVIFKGGAGLHFVRINRSTGEFMCDGKTLLANYNCQTVLLDRDKRLWIGTSNGLFRQNTRKNVMHAVDLSALVANNQSQVYTPSGFFVDGASLYIGNHTYLPILVLDAATYKFKKRISFEKLSPQCNQIWHILPYHKDTIWFATQSGIVWYNASNGHFNKLDIPALRMLRDEAITLCYKDSQGLIWLQGAWGSGLILYDPVTQLAKKYSIKDSLNHLPLTVVNYIAEDRQGNIWLAEEGLIRWNRYKQQFDTLISSYYGFNKDNININSLSSDSKGQLVFSNDYNGVLLYDPEKRRYRQISTDNLLDENAAMAAKALLNDHLWIVTHNNITAWHASTGKAINYSHEDGLPVEHFSEALFSEAISHDTARQRILFGYDNYLVWTADHIKEEARGLTGFYIDRISLADDTTFYFPGEVIRFNYDQNNLLLHVSAINFNDPGNNRYAYRINETHWIPVGSENSIRFNNLAPGQYNIEIKYYSRASLKAAFIKKIRIVIRPPFWQASWFILTSALLLALVIYVYYRRSLHAVKRKANVDKQLAQMEMKALHAQMNPHFIFNCLNSIKEMILNNENREASRYLSKFARLIRLSLDQSVHTFITLHATIDYLQQYVEMEQIRTSRFTCSFEKDEELDAHETLLIPMLLQPVIENAIWHGISDRVKKIHITVMFMKHQDQLACLIEDNGIGIHMSQKNKQAPNVAHQSMGIKNINNRIRLLNEKYNFDVSMTITDKSEIEGETGTGTRVIILFPLKIHES